jgi:hypothetical protein
MQSDIKIEQSGRKNEKLSGSLLMLVINAHWMSSAFQQYRASIKFVETEGSYSGGNLADIVATVLERFHISDEVMTIAADNASNNRPYTDISTKSCLSGTMATCPRLSSEKGR